MVEQFWRSRGRNGGRSSRNLRLDVFFAARGRPVTECFDFFGIHFDRALGNDNSEVFDFQGFEEAFFRLEEEVVFLEDC